MWIEKANTLIFFCFFFIKIFKILAFSIYILLWQSQSFWKKSSFEVFRRFFKFYEKLLGGTLQLFAWSYSHIKFYENVVFLRKSCFLVLELKWTKISEEWTSQNFSHRTFLILCMKLQQHKCLKLTWMILFGGKKKHAL